MYKMLLCWRYLRTRYIALASIISVMLGVATMIVVNSVMAGFSHEMLGRMHDMQGDLSVDSLSLEGFYDFDYHQQEIQKVAGDYVVGMTPIVQIPAMLSFQVKGQWITRQVSLIGVDENTHAEVSNFGNFLIHPQNREKLSFNLRRGGYDVTDHQSESTVPTRKALERAGWEHRELRALYEPMPSSTPEDSDARPFPRESLPPDSFDSEPLPAEADNVAAGGDEETPALNPALQDPFGKRAAENPAQAAQVFDPAKEQHTGVIGGFSLFTFRLEDGQDKFLLVPGDDVRLSFPTAGTPPKVVSGVFTLVDFYETKLAGEFDNVIFMPLRKVQELRGMIAPKSGVGYVTAIHIKLKPDVDPTVVRDLLRSHFPRELYFVSTWKDKHQGILAAVSMETAILNVLLFLIIAVAGFGILAIFFMIVVEKTRDIGILKSLGASRSGIMGIFLGYGISLGIVGSGVGLVMGLLFVHYINEIADLLGRLTGRPLFDPSVYYLQKIPTWIDAFTLTWIVSGAILIAISASVLPARRAARLHPVEALRYE